MLRGAIFDMDGTLLDSMYVWKDFDKRYFESLGLESSEDLRDKIAPLTLEQAAALFRRDFGVTDSIPEIVRKVNGLVEDEYFYRVQPKPGVPEMLRSFEEAGVRMCVATATDRYMVEAALRRTGLARYFGKIFTSTEVGSSKREPETFELALAFLGTKREETWVFEDSLYAVKAAKRFGFPVAAVRDVHSERHWREIRDTADVYLDDIGRWREKLTVPEKG